MIVATHVTAGNVGDAAVAEALLAQDLPGADSAENESDGQDPLEVYGDSAYGTGALLQSLEQAGAQTFCKTQPPRAPGGRFPKSDFLIDLDAATVSCPAGQTVALRPLKHHRQLAGARA